MRGASLKVHLVLTLALYEYYVTLGIDRYDHYFSICKFLYQCLGGTLMLRGYASVVDGVFVLFFKSRFKQR